MNPTVDSILCSIVASIICDVSKYALGQVKYKKISIEKKDIENCVVEKFGEKYRQLCDSGIFIDFLKSPLIIDTINNYIIYVVTGKVENKLIQDSILSKKRRNKNLEESDIIKFFADSLQKRYLEVNSTIIPEYSLTISFFTEFLSFGCDYLFRQLDKEEIAMAYFINNKINLFSDSIFEKLDAIAMTLNRSINLDIIYLDEKLLKDKEYYTKILKDNHRTAHIYLLDKFDINEFYVPPFLVQRGYQKKLFFEHKNNYYMRKLDAIDWRYIFERNNIIYIIGGAGYGKTLFMKKLMVEYEELNLINASEYIIIYGELKNFFANSTNIAIPVIDFLQNSMKKETLIEDARLSHDLINYYLKRGRCIILLDALDEVDRDKRQELHSSIIHYFKNQNPNNKICITSRARGFLPERDIEVYEIEPLDSQQIITYVDNIIKLGRFDECDKESFLQQTEVLVNKGFLNSFLVLSLLINIYKAERELPENKLELYQKCFEYIANKREKEKSQEKYDWSLISTLMKDNTFMELANLCLPNNSDVSKNIIKEKLIDIYKTKYVSENQTELAIEQFLVFCSDRTELFVPSSGEDCYKFFHRSFFEYFYSQYIFTRMETVEKIYDAWRIFDVDSEVFELTLAMFKQKNEVKYQEIVEYILNRIMDSFLNKDERINAFNMFVLCLQIIDDELYKKQFIGFLISESKFCIDNIKRIHNQKFIVDVINSKSIYSEEISNKYKEISIFQAVEEFVKEYPTIIQFLQQNNKHRNYSNDIDMLKIRYRHFYNHHFYSQIFFSHTSIGDVFSKLTTSDIATLGKIVGATGKVISKLQAKYKKFIMLKPDMKEKVEKIMLERE